MLFHCSLIAFIFFFFFFNDTATTEIYTLSLHDALPIFQALWGLGRTATKTPFLAGVGLAAAIRSEEHTSELQSPCNLVCRLLLEKKKKNEPQLHHELSRRRPTPTSCNTVV